MLLNTSHVEIGSTLCIQFVYLHGKSISERNKQDMSPCLVFYNLIWKFLTFLNRSKNNTSPKKLK